MIFYIEGDVMIHLGAILLFLIPVIIEYIKNRAIEYDSVKNFGLVIFGVACLVSIQEKGDFIDLCFFVVYAIIIIILSVLENKEQKNMNTEHEKEKENCKILTQKYYEFCKNSYIEAQKELVTIHVKYVLGVDDYQKYNDDVRTIKTDFYERIEIERDRYLHGEIDNVLEFKYYSMEWVLYHETLEKICREFYDLMYYAK